MPILPKAIYRCDAIFMKIPMAFLYRKRTIPKFIWNYKRPQNPKQFLEMAKLWASYFLILIYTTKLYQSKQYGIGIKVNTHIALVVEHLPANEGDARDAGSTPGLGRSPREGNVNPFQYAFMENLMNKGAWRPWGYKQLDKTEHTHTHWLINGHIGQRNKVKSPEIKL